MHWQKALFTLICRTISALLLFAAVNVVIGAAPPPPPEAFKAADFILNARILAEGKPSSWWLARSYMTAPHQPEVVICGSSQIGGLQAADARVLNKPIDFVENHHCDVLERDLRGKLGINPYVFISALPGAMISDHFAIAKSLFAAKGKPALLVLTVSPRDFIDNTLPGAGATEPYKFFSAHSDLTSFTDIAYNDGWSRMSHFVSSELPLRRLTTEIENAQHHWTEVNSDSPADTTCGVEQKAAAAADLSQQVKFVMGGYQGNIRPGDAVLYPSHLKIFVNNVGDYKKRYRNTHPANYEAQMQYFKNYLSYLSDQGVRVLVVGMPLTELNRDILPADFWQEFRGRLLLTCGSTGAEWLDLSDSKAFTVDDFVDTVHLNADGGVKLADKIANRIGSSRELSAALYSRLPAVAAKEAPETF
ncbi:MAG: hypothetical protein KGS72_11140 [Cyanobacteria bacterium REEB67]|nr:hypothetical protein [Cyanobacteria bacterium REEB67]